MEEKRKFSRWELRKAAERFCGDLEKLYECGLVPDRSEIGFWSSERYKKAKEILAENEKTEFDGMFFIHRFVFEGVKFRGVLTAREHGCVQVGTRTVEKEENVVTEKRMVKKEVPVWKCPESGKEFEGD